MLLVLNKAEPTTDYRLLIAVAILLLLAGVCKGLMDLISFHWSKAPEWMKSREGFWNPKLSWRNKWKDGQPEKGEAYLFSSSLLVAFTDGWHLLQMVFLTSIATALALLIKFGEWKDRKIQLLVFSIKWLAVRALIGLGFKISYK